MPPLDGTLAAAGLSSAVTVVRDRFGVPHITAATADDLFFAQGFVQAQDRLFQMDLWRRSVQGRLAEVLGSNFIERDAMTRRLQYRGDANGDWAALDPDSRRIATAFTSGINAWIDHAEAAGLLPDEFRLAGWTPERWRPDDLLNRTDAFLASVGARDEVFHARLAAALGASGLDALFPGPRPARPPAGVDLAAITYRLSDGLLAVGASPFFAGFAAPFAGGSNVWAVSGLRSATGAPLVAADPHRPLTAPPLRYLIHLTAPGWNVAGATAPWLPGIAIGHNEHIAWGTASAPVDVQDIYVEQVNPANDRQVRFAGRWVDMIVEREQVIVKGSQEPFEYERLYTRHGPVVGIDRSKNLAYALRWTGLEPGGAAELGALALNRAASIAEARAALSRWRMPVVDFVVADGERIWKQRAGLGPVRGGDGRLPLRGWLAADEWTGVSNLSAVEESAAAVWAANDDAARMQRIGRLLDEGAPFTLESLAMQQRDTFSVRAEALLPLFARSLSAAADDRVRSAAERLLAWNRRMDADSADARLYARWEEALARRIAEARVPRDLIDETAARLPLVDVVLRPTRAWFGDAPARNRDASLWASLADAVARSAPEDAAPRTVTFAHVLGISADSRALFDAGPFPVGGDAHTIQAVSGRTPVGPALRMLLDVAAWDRSQVVNAPGQSGWPASPHVRDHAEVWARGEYVPLLFSESAIAGHAESTLRLTPP